MEKVINLKPDSEVQIDKVLGRMLEEKKKKVDKNYQYEEYKKEHNCRFKVVIIENYKQQYIL